MLVSKETTLDSVPTKLSPHATPFHAHNKDANGHMEVDDQACHLEVFDIIARYGMEEASRMLRVSLEDFVTPTKEKSGDARMTTGGGELLTGDDTRYTILSVFFSTDR